MTNKTKESNSKSDEEIQYVKNLTHYLCGISKKDPPDVIINLGSIVIGVEVTKVYVDQSSKGSSLAESDSKIYGDSGDSKLSTISFKPWWDDSIINKCISEKNNKIKSWNGDYDYNEKWLLIVPGWTNHAGDCNVLDAHGAKNFSPSAHGFDHIYIYLGNGKHIKI